MPAVTNYKLGNIERIWYIEFVMKFTEDMWWTQWQLLQAPVELIDSLEP